MKHPYLIVLSRTQHLGSKPPLIPVLLNIASVIGRHAAVRDIAPVDESVYLHVIAEFRDSVEFETVVRQSHSIGFPFRPDMISVIMRYKRIIDSRTVH